jgi:hypothetical protein
LPELVHLVTQLGKGSWNSEQLLIEFCLPALLSNNLIPPYSGGCNRNWELGGYNKSSITA